ncbi:hypothetical protein KAFR_0G03300 [Kazachstania africana CBS 2517]|uniref:Uncharacterized protein n=1 Tax=Kazachstania africana (strain ATCC 22294 / BCRC 22015 / CBS 2517 / CECT 1963 / NBRC 1671 / NRRL Y-8276) TaxID=1071382 RepID=H2AYB2_KAZAF|nr:hypothetical protein KAFR_0G03300 [Kazachstania africana CBS 2517]CCF59362.1 hypothetical protein KAFR_0G03300 [Kazachstania africana CBS 2517]
MINDRNLVINGNDRISRFIKTHLLSFLRSNHYTPSSHSDVVNVLSHWWITLLNFLNNDIGPTKEQRFASNSACGPNLIVIILECISRIMTILINDSHSFDKTIYEKYSNNLLMTLHFITNKLILNSKKMKRDKSNYQHYSKYNLIIRSFLGKLNAYSFIYLSTDLKFDIQLLISLASQRINFSVEENIETSLPWKTHHFQVTKFSNRTPKIVETKDNKFFKIIISYLKNESIYQSFYFHYLYLALTLTERSGSSVYDFPALKFLTTLTMIQSLKCDIPKIQKFLKSSSSLNNSNSYNDKMPDIENQNILTPDKYDSFLLKASQTIKLWQILNKLTQLFPQNITPLLMIHDNLQLNYFQRKIVAYDFKIANFVYDKLLRTMLQNGIHFINWDRWTLGHINLIKTLNINCQLISLISIFNIWEEINVENRYKIVEFFLNDSIWYQLTLDVSNNLITIIFIKLVVFKIRQIMHNENLKMRLLEKLLLFELLKIDKSEFNNSPMDSVLFFNGNRKFIFGKLHGGKDTSKNIVDIQNVFGPLDIEESVDENGMIPAVEQMITGVREKDKFGFKVMFLPLRVNNIQHWNDVWKRKKPTSDRVLPSIPNDEGLLKLNLSIFGDLSRYKDIVHREKQTNAREMSNIVTFIKIFNLTIREYDEINNLNLNEEKEDPIIYIDFEIFK